MKQGIDIVEIGRIRKAVVRNNSNFIARVFTLNEQKQLLNHTDNYEKIAGLWAAKEAAVKALGTGYSLGVGFHHVEIDYDCYGCPGYKFSGEFLKIFNESNFSASTLSISHCRAYAVAIATLY